MKLGAIHLATTAYTNFISGVQALLAADASMPTGAIMSPRSYTVLGGLLDTTNQPRARPAILDNTKFIATSQIPNNLIVGSSSDCTEIYLGDFSKVIYFMREGVSVQMLKELYSGTGEILPLPYVRGHCSYLPRSNGRRYWRQTVNAMRLVGECAKTPKASSTHSL